MAEINKKIDDLQQMFDDFEVPAYVINTISGPRVTQYQVKPGTGTKVSKITSLKNDIQLALKAKNVHIEAPIPGTEFIGIEVPNDIIKEVDFAKIANKDVLKRAKGTLPFILGEDITGIPIVADLVKMPHLLIAGATNSGKSVCINTIINSFLIKFNPRQLKFVMIDPKQVELGVYNNIPHLIQSVVSSPSIALVTLQFINNEIQKRYRILSNLGCRNIEEYNSKNNEKMYRIVVIIDELADLMMTAPKDIETQLVRIAQLGRAAGIHLVVATQRPTTNIITGLIKANVPSRIAFTVAAGIDSRVILDRNGAEDLLGKGDMLYHPVGKLNPIRIQGAYISNKIINCIVDQ